MNNYEKKARNICLASAICFFGPLLITIVYGIFCTLPSVSARYGIAYVLLILLIFNDMFLMMTALILAIIARVKYSDYKLSLTLIIIYIVIMVILIIVGAVKFLDWLTTCPE